MRQDCVCGTEQPQRMSILKRHLGNAGSVRLTIATALRAKHWAVKRRKQVVYE